MSWSRGGESADARPDPTVHIVCVNDLGAIMLAQLAVPPHWNPYASDFARLCHVDIGPVIQSCREQGHFSFLFTSSTDFKLPFVSF